MNKRLGLIIFILFIGGAAIIGRLFIIQVLGQNLYRAWAIGQQTFFSTIAGERGEILFSNREKLATDTVKKFAYISPKEIKQEDKEKIEIALGQILDLDQNFIKEQINQDSFYELLKKSLSDREIDQIQRLNLLGIYIGQESTRVYPQEEMASQVIGFVNAQNLGQYGLEGYYQDILAGKETTLVQEKGGKDLILSSSGKKVQGNDLLLTLDYNIQFQAEKMLAQARKDYNFKSGGIIVINPNDGEVLALANYPSFDPNNYDKEKDLGIFKNPVLQKIFEPGSVFKPITMAAAIDENKITPQTTYTDEGVVKIGNRLIYNYANRTYGLNTMTQVLEKSINTGAVFAQQQLGSEMFLKYLESFGFFEKTGIDLQGEVYSENKELKKGYEINFATASFGQGIEITPIQLVRAFSAIANKGKMVKPYLVKKIINSDGSTTETKPELSREIISPQTSSQVASMMVSVIENGYSKKAKIPGYFIAGKTGTAQVPWGALEISKSGYSDETVQSFLGFAPAYNPKFLILVKLDNPEAKTAEYSAMPIFRDLAKYIIDLWQIPPDYEDGSHR